MRIAIDGSRAFLPNRTGIEEYSYQVIKHLRDNLNNHQVVLYMKHDQDVDFDLPEMWMVKKMWFPRFWTQIRFAFELLFDMPDVLFVPAHTVPWIHPKNTIVTIHGLEYEYFPNAYSLWERIYMRFVISNSCKWSKTIISVSENTKKDVVKIYGIDGGKIKVVYEGYNRQMQKSKIKNQNDDSEFPSEADKPLADKIQNSKFILFVGRIEERKNIINIVKAFEILKEKYGLLHKLVLVGKPGYGYENAKCKIQNTKFKDEIIELGYITEEEKWELLKRADAFVFPTLYEGFGIPVLEAQSVGCPVVTSNTSSLPEITTCHSVNSTNYEYDTNLRITNKSYESALLVDPLNPEEISEALHSLISDESLKNDIIQKGFKNIERFSWEKCAKEIAEILEK